MRNLPYTKEPLTYNQARINMIHLLMPDEVIQELEYMAKELGPEYSILDALEIMYSTKWKHHDG